MTIPTIHQWRYPYSRTMCGRSPASPNHRVDTINVVHEKDSHLVTCVMCNRGKYWDREPPPALTKVYEGYGGPTPTQPVHLDVRGYQTACGCLIRRTSDLNWHIFMKTRKSSVQPFARGPATIDPRMVTCKGCMRTKAYAVQTTTLPSSITKLLGMVRRIRGKK